MTTLKVSSPAELLSLVPYLIGFHPADSLVVVALYGHRLGFTVRADLPVDDSPLALRHLVATVARHRPDGVVVLGYGTGTRLRSGLARLATTLDAARIAVHDELWITGGRYRSVRCPDPDCCPPQGTPCPPADAVLAAEMAYTGAVALPGRADLEASLAPVAGAGRDAMDRAEIRALARLLRLSCDAVAGAEPGGRVRRFDRFMLGAGRAAVRAAEERYRCGGNLDDDELAWLVCVLQHLGVRDYAWTRTGVEEWQLTFWSDVVGRTSSAHVAAPAAILAFMAWRAHRGALASVALDRALAGDPDYRLARIMQQVLLDALPPALLEGWPDIPGLTGETLARLSGELATDLPARRGGAVSRTGPRVEIGHFTPRHARWAA